MNLELDETQRTATPSSQLRILGLGPNPWRSQWMNRQQILSRLGARHGVVYSNGSWSVWDRQNQAYRLAPWLGSWTFTDRVWADYPPKYLLSWPTQPRYERLVRGLMQRRWLSKLRALPSEAPLVAYLFHPKFVDYVDRRPIDRFVYHPPDLFRSMPSWSALSQAQEDSLLAKADVVITASE